MIEEGVPIPAPESGSQWHVNVPGFLGLFAGLALIIFGGYILHTAISYVGAFLFVISVGLGISVIGITRDFVENRRYAGLGPRGGRYRLLPWGREGYCYVRRRYVRDEKAVEDEEDRRRASGEED